MLNTINETCIYSRKCAEGGEKKKKTNLKGSMLRSNNEVPSQSEILLTTSVLHQNSYYIAPKINKENMTDK